MGKSVSTYAVVDEVEEDVFVVLFDDGPKIHLNRSMLPPGTAENSVLKVTFEIDADEEKRRDEKISDLQLRLLERTRKRRTE